MLGNIVLLILLIVSIYWRFKDDYSINEARSSTIVILVIVFALVYRIS